MYSSVRKPGHSMVNQAMRPGRLKMLSTEVLPMPYHEMAHCNDAPCVVSSRVVWLALDVFFFVFFLDSRD